MGATVAPYVPPPDEVRDSPPSPTKSKKTVYFQGYPQQPMMEMAEEKSFQGSVMTDHSERLSKRSYLREYKLPSGLSVEMPE